MKDDRRNRPEWDPAEDSSAELSSVELGSASPWDMWLMLKQDVCPPETFSSKVMSAVQQSTPAWRPAVKATSQRSPIPSQCVPYLLASTAAIVCAVRAYSLLHVLTEPTPEFSVVLEQTNQEVPNGRRDDSRS